MIAKKESEIAKIVLKGLQSSPKYLPSWLLYDEEGDKIFQKIMKLPEYYLTRCEAEILSAYKYTIFKHLATISKEWDIIELGAGDGTKTKILLESLILEGLDVNYHAIDISKNVLNILKENLEKEFPLMKMNMISAEYSEGLNFLSTSSNRPKLILFMGANIGNFEFKNAVKFLQTITTNFSQKDFLMVGFDLVKSPEIILKAYNDETGITRDFNFNLLKRINSELNANFNPEYFIHFPVYDPQTGSARSYLVSTKEQTINLHSIDEKINFSAWESIYTEISQKYSIQMISSLAYSSSLSLFDTFFDFRKYFSLTLFKKVKKK